MIEITKYFRLCRIYNEYIFRGKNALKYILHYTVYKENFMIHGELRKHSKYSYMLATCQ